MVFIVVNFRCWLNSGGNTTGRGGSTSSCFGLSVRSREGVVREDARQVVVYESRDGDKERWW